MPIDFKSMKSMGVFDDVCCKFFKPLRKLPSPFLYILR